MNKPAGFFTNPPQFNEKEIIALTNLKRTELTALKEKIEDFKKEIEKEAQAAGDEWVYHTVIRGGAMCKP